MKYIRFLLGQPVLLLFSLRYLFTDYVCVSCHHANKTRFCRLIVANGNFIIKHLYIGHVFYRCVAGS
jgi:hypothetical protein